MLKLNANAGVLEVLGAPVTGEPPSVRTRAG
jgi:hypothetical protein